MMATLASAATADPRRGRTSSSSRRRHGLLRPRLLRRRDRHAEPRRARGRRAAVHAVLQHRPLLPDAGQPAHRPVPAPGRRRPHDGGHGRVRRLPRRPQPPLRHHRRGAASRPATAPTPSASGTSPGTSGPDGPKHNWPLQRGFDRFYGTITGGGSFYDPFTLARDNTLISPVADPEYKPETYYYTDAITDHAVRFVGDHAEGPRGQAVLPVRRLHRRPLADARAAGGHRQVQGQVRRRLRADPQGPVREGREARADRPEAGHDARRPRTGTRWRTRSGRPRAWRSTRRWSTAWTRASASSSPS